MTAAPIDFFVSYTGDDKAWAEWIAWQLKTAGYTVRLQAWHFSHGKNFVAEIQDALNRSNRVICVASKAYFESRWTQEEWMARFYHGGNELLPVRIEPIELPGLLGPLAHVDLFDVAEDEALRRLLDSLKPAREPSRPPVFPGHQPGFPGRPSEPERRESPPAGDDATAGAQPSATGEAPPSVDWCGKKNPSVDWCGKKNLRGLFEAFKVKAAKAGRAEDPVLIPLCEAADEALYGETYDQELAHGAVTVYINTVNRRSEGGST